MKRTVKVTYTHYGSLGMCPVYIANPFDEDTALWAEWYLDWFLVLNAWMFNISSMLMDFLGIEHNRGFPICIKGELEEPFTEEYEEE